MAVTYVEVGATLGELPAGYRHVRREVVVGSGRERFERVADQLLGWHLQRAAGLRVRAGADRASPGVVVRLGVGLGPLRLTAPCEVVLVLDEPRRRGFAYGTLPGHPERGEELFVVRLDDDHRVVLTVTAFSRPATWWARLGAPVTAHVQDRVTDRYVRSLLP